jgi:hypothetical protein
MDNTPKVGVLCWTIAEAEDITRRFGPEVIGLTTHGWVGRRFDRIEVPPPPFYGEITKKMDWVRCIKEELPTRLRPGGKIVLIEKLP